MKLVPRVGFVLLLISLENRMFTLLGTSMLRKFISAKVQTQSFVEKQHHRVNGYNIGTSGFQLNVESNEQLLWFWFYDTRLKTNLSSITVL